MSDFTATDRRRIVEKLMSDDYVLEALHHVIFSVPEDMGGGGPPGSAGSRGESRGSAGGGDRDSGPFSFMDGVPGVGAVPDDDGDYVDKARTGA